jgi:hypothetical protein
LFDRLRTRRLHDDAYLPFLHPHLYHMPQPGKLDCFGGRSRVGRHMRLPPAAGGAELRRGAFGRPTGPWATRARLP